MPRSELHPKPDPPHRIKSTNTTFDILETVIEKDGAKLDDIAEDIGVSKSTVLKHLQTLHHREYVTKSGNVYDVSLKFLDAGIHSRNRNRLYDASKPELKQLAEETDEIAWVTVEEFGWGVFLGKEEGERAVETNLRVGERTYLHSTSGGKAILAHLPEKYVERVIEVRGLPKISENTIVDRDDLFEELERTRETGVAFSESARAYKVRAASCPIIIDDEVAGSIGVVGPKERLTGNRFREEIPNLVKSAANAIELNLTYEA